MIEEVKKYKHLYNPSCPGYHGRIMVNNAWKEISKNLERPESEFEFRKKEWKAANETRPC